MNLTNLAIIKSVIKCLNQNSASMLNAKLIRNYGVINL